MNESSEVLFSLVHCLHLGINNVIDPWNSAKLAPLKILLGFSIGFIMVGLLLMSFDIATVIFWENPSTWHFVDVALTALY